MAYFIIPDQSPNANAQHPTIALKGPLFQTTVVKEISNSTEEEKNFFVHLLYGSHSNYKVRAVDTIFNSSEGLVAINHYNQLTYIDEDQLYDSNDIQSNIYSRTFYLGTDKYGRDVLSRLILGIRISLLVGFLAVFVSLVVGVSLGAIGGYFGGKIDQTIMFFINVTWSIPTLLLVFAIVLALGKSVGIIFLAVGLTLWVDVARIVRGQVMSVKEEQFIRAARSMSFSTTRIILRHILPNIIGPILVIASSNFAIAILIEAGLSYLGFGVQPPAPSIGNMLYENYGYAISGKVYIAIIPAVTIMILVLAFNMIGTGLRDIFDVRMEKA